MTGQARIASSGCRVQNKANCPIATQEGVSDSAKQSQLGKKFEV